MLAGKRSLRVGDQILKEISYLLLERVTDPRVKGITITGVDLSNDLKRARVFFSIMGDRDQVKRAQTGLDSAKGYIKREMGFRLALKYIPEIVFIYDPSLKSGNEMEQLFEKLKLNESRNDTE